MSGESLLRMLLVAGTAVACTQLIRGKTPALATAVSLAAVLALLGLLLPQLRAAWQAASAFPAEAGLDGQLFLPVLKVLAITQITHLSAELCRDAGERAVAAKLELCGAVSALLCVLPLAEQALALIGALGT